MSIYRRASDGKWVGTLDLGEDAQGSVAGMSCTANCAVKWWRSWTRLAAG
jgi:hypothetical protein